MNIPGQILPKTAWNWKNLVAGGGGRASKILLCRSANDIYTRVLILKFKIQPHLGLNPKEEQTNEICYVILIEDVVLDIFPSRLT